jgi:glyoxylase-like metal-dependent hydrolase (beta-lactamase superfamily II)/ferredoxin
VAQVENRLPQNAEGNFFVDRSCIDCDTCRTLAPTVFVRSDEDQQSFVTRQPSGGGDERVALMALVACPVGAIGTTAKTDVAPGVDAFPNEIADGVYYCGFASESSFGAASYLIRRPEGNVLVDSPRAARPLIRRLKEMGGVRTMFLTHRDDVADHDFFRRELGCERILHRSDVSAGTADVECPLDGDEPIALAPDLLAIPVPGHTAGSMALLYQNEFLFSGDHVWWSEARGRLHASRCVNWHCWDTQVRSLRRLLRFQFRCILPAHGRRCESPTAEAMRHELARLLSQLETPKAQGARAESR